MVKYIIVVEYSVPEIDISKKVLDFLKTKGNCLILTNHSFMLATDSSAVELRDALKRFGDEVKSIFVTQMAPPAAWVSSLSENSDIKSMFHE